MSLIGPWAAFFTAQSAGGASAAATLGGNCAVGQTLVIAGAIWRATTASPIAVTDSLGNTYTVIETASPISWGGGVAVAFLAYSVVTNAGSPVVTVTPVGGSSYINAGLTLIDGTFDAAGTEGTGTSTTPSGGITTLTNDAIILGVMTLADGNVSITNASGQMQMYVDTSSGICPYNFAWKQAATAGAFTMDWTIGASKAWSVLTISLKSNSASGGGEHSAVF